MIDFHTHILPGIDDGCQHVAESVELLMQLSEQGVKLVALTPHYYASQQSIQSFLKRRTASYEHLQANLKGKEPDMLLGAEVLYFRGISQMDDLSELCLQGTRLLLLEMPFRKWTANEVDEVCRITQTTGLVIMLAHIERYLAWQSKGVWKQLQEHGVIMQVNVSFFAQSSFPLRALRMLRSDKIQVLGTDTHNLHSRPPYMDRARDTILKYLGKNMWNKLERQSYGYLEANRK